MGIYGVHDIKVNDMGSYATAELHVEVQSDLVIKEVHKLAHQVEKAIIKKVDIITTVIVHENFYKPYVFSKFMCMGLIFLVVIVV
jgi:divalent metal cation (Fe/Co/Zn/Cd) transporter